MGRSIGRGCKEATRSRNSRKSPCTTSTGCTATHREKKDDDDNDDDYSSEGGAGAVASSSSSTSPSTTTAEEAAAEDAGTETEAGTEKVKSKKQLVLQPMRWGLVPCFSKQDQTSRFASQMINARSEGVRSSPIFRRLLAKNRCVVVADGFFEWHKFEKNGQTKKQPYYVFPSPSHQASPITLGHYSTETPKDDTASPDAESDATSKTSTLDYNSNTLSEADKRPLLLLAGLFDRWTDPKTGKVLFTFTVLTTEPTQNLGWLHDRMPVVLTEERAKKWLDVYHTPFEECVSFLSPYKHNLEWYAVPDTVNSIRNKSPECTEKLEDVMARRKANGIGRFFASTSKPQTTKGKMPDFNKANEERVSKPAPDIPTLIDDKPSPSVSSPSKPKAAPSVVEAKEAPTKANKIEDVSTKPAARGSKRKSEPKASPKKAAPKSTKKPKIKASPKKADPDSRQRTLASFFGSSCV